MRNTDLQNYPDLLFALRSNPHRWLSPRMPRIRPRIVDPGLLAQRIRALLIGQQLVKRILCLAHDSDGQQPRLEFFSAASSPSAGVNALCASQVERRMSNALIIAILSSLKAARCISVGRTARSIPAMEARAESSS